MKKSRFRGSFISFSFASFSSQDDFFQDNGKHADNQIQVEGEESPDQQCQADGAVFEYILEIQQESAFLCAARAGKRRIAGADKKKAADRQDLIPGGSGQAESVIDKNGRGKQ